MPGMPDSEAPAAPSVALGFDFGTRRIGVAAGDTLTRGARPVGTVGATDRGPDWVALGRYVREWAPHILVVGVPYNMDGSPGSLTASALRFATELGDRFGLSVVTVDERLSSREAEDILRSQRASGARTRRVRHEDVDSAAACVLLEQWLRDGTRPNE
jgi:putative Holliday junction resolvase